MRILRLQVERRGDRVGLEHHPRSVTQEWLEDDDTDRKCQKLMDRYGQLQPRRWVEKRPRPPMALACQTRRIRAFFRRIHRYKESRRLPG